ncbi:MAG: hypothetical protein KAJ03_01750 [Gammaproteobacteria bacterium]|nr:hypothetical protein [Gammaproteobacteria bacterium]
MISLDFVPIELHGMSFITMLFFVFGALVVGWNVRRTNDIDSRTKKTELAVASIDTSIKGIEKNLDGIIQNIQSTFSDGTENYVKIITAVLNERKGGE